MAGSAERDDGVIAATAPPAPAVFESLFRKPRRALALPLARGLAAFFGAFGLLNLVARLSQPIDVNVWWIDLRLLPGWLAVVAMAPCAAALLAFGLRPRMSVLRRRLTAAGAALLTTIALVNASQFYRAWSRGEIDPLVPLPLSLLIAACLAAIAIGVWRTGGAVPVAKRSCRPLLPPLLTAGVACLCILAFPVLQMAFFGTTDFRRHADAIVVLGAQVHKNGLASFSLAERMATGIELYKQGYAPLLVVSGGRGDGAVHESIAMRDLAVAAGVPKEDVVMDMRGINTRATARNVAALMRHRHISRVLVVSHFYHLARTKMAFAEQGVDPRTVPTSRAHFSARVGYVICREIPAFWVYYFRELGG